MAQKFTEEQIEELREAFKIFDKDGDGTISVDEIKSIMTSRNEKLSDEEIKKLMSKVDTDGSGLLEFDEFVQLMAMQSANVTREDELRAAFQHFDVDGSGKITREELGQVMREMGQKLSDAELKDIIDAVDQDGDGQIDFAEFVKLMNAMS